MATEIQKLFKLLLSHIELKCQRESEYTPEGYDGWACRDIPNAINGKFMCLGCTAFLLKEALKK